jgi:hypothetical protein
VADLVGCFEVTVSGRGADVIRRRLPALMELLAEGVSGRPPAKVPELGDRAVRGISGGKEVRAEDMRWRLVRGGRMRDRLGIWHGRRRETQPRP